MMSICESQEDGTPWVIPPTQESLISTDNERLDIFRFVIVLGPTSSVIDICTYLLGWFYYGVKSTDDKQAVKLFQTHWFLQG